MATNRQDYGVCVRHSSVHDVTTWLGAGGFRGLYWGVKLSGLGFKGSGLGVKGSGRGGRFSMRPGVVATR